MKKLQGRRGLRLLVTSLLAATLSVVTLSAPAQAHEGAYSTSFVDGAGERTDDFGDHDNEVGYLCWGCANSWNTDLVVMWQAILFAENLLEGDEIDGRFGSRTHSATRAWQRRYGLDDDGIVGGATWGKADNLLTWRWCCASNYWWVRYESSVTNGIVRFTRGSGHYGSGGSYELTWVGTTQGGQRIEFTSTDNDHTVIHFYKRTLVVRVK